MRRNEKPCVCNVFATPHSKNPVKSSVPSSLNVNFSYQRDNLPFGTDNFKQYLRTSQDFGLGRFFACILDEDNGIIY